MIPKKFTEVPSSMGEQVARTAWPHGALLTCQVCGFIRDETAESCNHYLFGAGWPKCCGQTMRLERKQV